MKKGQSSFGWDVIFSAYVWKDFGKDCIIPSIVSFVIGGALLYSNADILQQLLLLLDLGIAIIPTMVALMVAAYAIVLSFLTNEKFKMVAQTDDGKNLISQLNSGFASSLTVMAFTLFVLIIIVCFARLNIACCYADVVNMVAYFILCFLLVFTVSTLKNIIVDLFNCGQTVLF